ncbi:MAG: sulfur transferase domain-containing protein [Bryobacteraceae bacterium]|jgi:protein tyrosine/serine phosphatase
MSFIERGLISVIFLGLPALAAPSPVPGIKNFYQVDQQVYRGAQPTPEGFSYLSRLGVKVVLDLRKDDARSVSEQRLVTAAGMRYINVPMTGLTPPTQADTDRLLTLLEDPAAGPIFVHCKRGADRTGAVIAAYRIDHGKWDNARALEEAMTDGMSGWQFQRQEYIRTFHGRAMAVPPIESAVAGTRDSAAAK